MKRYLRVVTSMDGTRRYAYDSAANPHSPHIYLTREAASGETLALAKGPFEVVEIEIPDVPLAKMRPREFAGYVAVKDNGELAAPDLPFIARSPALEARSDYRWAHVTVTIEEVEG